MQFTITISGEKQELADGLAILKAMMGEQIGDGEVTATVKPESKKTSKSTKSDKPVKSDPVEEPETEVSEDEEVEEITDVDLRAAASKVAKAGKQDDVKALLKEFDVANVTALPQKDRAKFIKKLEEL